MSFSLEILEDINAVDLESIRNLVGQLGEKHSPGDEKQMKSVVGSKNSKLVVARNDDAQLVGMVIVNVIPKVSNNEARIDDVVVDESMRGQGLGKAIMNRAIEEAWGMGADKIELTSRASREAANALYQKLGFERRETNVYIMRKGQ